MTRGSWLSWVWTGLVVALGSAFAVVVLAGPTISPSGGSDDGFGQLAMLAIGVVSGASSLSVPAVLMPILIMACKDCFRSRSGIVVAGGVVAAIALPYWIREGFDPGVLFFAAGPYFSAILMAIIARNRLRSGT